jgi:hypothetical protein
MTSSSTRNRLSDQDKHDLLNLEGAVALAKQLLDKARVSDPSRCPAITEKLKELEKKLSAYKTAHGL